MRPWSFLITVLACDELFCWVESYRGLGGGVRNVTQQTGWQVSSLITYRVFKQTVTSVPIDHTAQTLNTETWAVLCHPHPAAVQCHQTAQTMAGTPRWHCGYNTQSGSVFLTPLPLSLLYLLLMKHWMVGSVFHWVLVFPMHAMCNRYLMARNISSVYHLPWKYFEIST